MKTALGNRKHPTKMSADETCRKIARFVGESS